MNNALYTKLCALPDLFPGLKTLSTVDRDLPYLLGCGNLEQFVATLRGLIDPENWCPFCKTSLLKKPPLFFCDGWYAKENDFRGDGTHATLLIIPERHVVGEPPTPADWATIGTIMGKLITQYGIKGGGIVARFGDPCFHVGSIPHFHINVIAPTGETEIRTPLAKSPEDHAKAYTRMIGFRNKVHELGRLVYLFSC